MLTFKKKSKNHKQIIFSYCWYYKIATNRLGCD